MTGYGHSIRVIDSHTEGEPTRIVLDGEIGGIEGVSMSERVDFLREHRDEVRRALVLEPRGHDAIVLAILTPPVTDGADAGVIFANDAGYLGMCGHGTIGVASALVELGLVEVAEPITRITFDTPAGAVVADVRVTDGRPRSVAFRNVASFVQETNRPVHVTGLGDIEVDIAYGGNWFAFVPWSAVGIEVVPQRLDALMSAAKAIRAGIRSAGIVGRHPVTGVVDSIDHVKIWTDESGARGPATRALTLCPGRAYDRSPCGTGTSAKLALLAADPSWTEGLELRSRSILGTEFRARVAARTTVGGVPAIVPEIEGSAWITGRNELVLDPDDPLVHGIG